MDVPTSRTKTGENVSKESSPEVKHSTPSPVSMKHHSSKMICSKEKIFKQISIKTAPIKSKTKTIQKMSKEKMKTKTRQTTETTTSTQFDEMDQPSAVREPSSTNHDKLEITKTVSLSTDGKKLKKPQNVSSISRESVLLSETQAETSRLRKSKLSRTKWHKSKMIRHGGTKTVTINTDNLKTNVKNETCDTLEKHAIPLSCTQSDTTRKTNSLKRRFVSPSKKNKKRQDTRNFPPSSSTPTPVSNKNDKNDPETARETKKEHDSGAKDSDAIKDSEMTAKDFDVMVESYKTARSLKEEKELSVDNTAEGSSSSAHVKE
uniref:Uncharacterized protein n=1 Tax=Panagrolaimus sp. JU765 TaxID=591449 RepID=A0AC34Q7S3_9BILA